VRHRLAGDVKNGRASNSVLPHVRTDQSRYAQYDTTLKNLYVTRQWKAGPNLYARGSFGYFESMFGGLSGELLWKPVNSRLALGVEANYLKQRDYNQQFGFRNYDVWSGFVSAYYEAGQDYLVQLDVGRYLAGDIGATMTVTRTFDNGWELGGFFTLTDVSAADFGEGSFDKGLIVRVPLGWMLGKPSRNTNSTVIRPIQRDGGQRANTPDHLYRQVRDNHRRNIYQQRSGFWE
jgi:hypothetical protein